MTSGSRPPLDSTTITKTRSGSGKQPPAAGHALQSLLAAVLKDQSRPGDEGWHGSRDQHLTRAGQRGHPGPDVDRHATDIFTATLDLACMYAGPSLQSK